jgi:hypothetical protein
MHPTRHRLRQALVTAAMAVGGTLAWPPLVAHAQAVTPHFLPLPEQARPVAEPTIGYKVQRAGDSGYVVIAGFVQATFVVTHAGVVVIDAPPALADKLARGDQERHQQASHPRDPLA